MGNYHFCTTEKAFENLSFSDCKVTSVQEYLDELVIELDGVYILEEHPLNLSNSAKSTNQCRLTFKNVSSIRAELYMDINPRTVAEYLESDVESTLETKAVESLYLNEMDIETFRMTKNDKELIFNFQGLDRKSHEFCGLIVQAKGFKLEWNDFFDND